MLKSISLFLKLSLIYFLGLYFISLTVSAQQSPMSDIYIEVVSDGLAPFDATTYVPPSTNSGTDSDPNNLVVRTSDTVVYNVETNLNGSDDTGHYFILNVTNGKIENIPSTCFSPNPNDPIPSLSPDRTQLICFTGLNQEGAKSTIQVSVIAGIVANGSSLSVEGTVGSDNSPIAINNAENITITGAPRVDLVKTSSAADNPAAQNNAITDNVDINGDNVPDGKVIEYRVLIEHQRGSVVFNETAFSLQDVFQYTSNDPDPSNIGARLYTQGADPACYTESGTGTITCTRTSTPLANPNDPLQSIAGQTLEFDVDITGINDSQTPKSGVTGSYIIQIFIPIQDTGLTPDVTTTSNEIFGSGADHEGFHPSSTSIYGTTDFNFNNVNEYVDTQTGTNNTYSIGVVGVPPGGGCYDISGVSNPGWDACSSGRLTAKVNSEHPIYPGVTTGINLLGVERVEDDSYRVPGEEEEIVLCTQQTFDTSGSPLFTFEPERGPGTYFVDPQPVESIMQVAYKGPRELPMLDSSYRFTVTNNYDDTSSIATTPFPPGSGPKARLYNVSTSYAESLFDDYEIIFEWTDAPLAYDPVNPHVFDCDDSNGWTWYERDDPAMPPKETLTRGRVRFIYSNDVLDGARRTAVYGNLRITPTAAVENVNKVPLWLSAYRPSVDEWVTTALVAGDARLDWDESNPGNTGGPAPSTQAFKGVRGQDVLFTQEVGVKIYQDLDPTFMMPLEEGQYTLQPQFIASPAQPAQPVTVTNTIDPLLEVLSVEIVCPSGTCTGGTPINNSSGNTIDIEFPATEAIALGNPLPEIVVTFRATAGSAGESITNTSYVNTPLSTVPDSLRRDITTLFIGSTNGFNLLKETSQSLEQANSQISFDLYSFNSSRVPSGPSEYIDVLPFNGDSVDPQVRFEPSNFSGTVEYDSITHPSLVEGTDYVLMYTSQDPALISVDPKCTSNNAGAATYALDGGDAFTNATHPQYCITDVVTEWCTSLSGGSCPADNSEITAVKIMQMTDKLVTDPLEGYTITLNTEDNQEGDIYTNNWSGRAEYINLPVISNDVSVEIIAGSISDFVWNDLNQDGVQDSGEPGIPGVEVHLYEDFDGDGVPDSAPVQITTTDASGNYNFEGLPASTNDDPAGTYIVQIYPQGYVPTPGAGDGSSTGNGADLDGISTPYITAVTLEALVNANNEIYQVQNRSDVDFGLIQTEAVIGLAKRITSGPTLNGANASGVTLYDIEFAYVFENLGETSLTNFTLQEDFGGVFGVTAADITINSITCTATGAGVCPVTIDPAYTGAAPNDDVYLQDDQSLLGPSETFEVVISMTLAKTLVNPETYLNKADTFADALYDLDGDGDLLNDDGTPEYLTDPVTGDMVMVTDTSTDGVDPDTDGNDTDGSSDNDNNPNEDDTTPVLLTPPSADLMITKTEATASGPYQTGGQTITWEITITNNGPTIAINPVMFDILPAEISYVGNNIPAPWTCNHDGSSTGGVLSCQYDGAVSSGNSVTFEVETVTHTVEGVALNVVDVSSETYDGVSTNNRASANAIIGNPETDVQIVKTDDEVEGTHYVVNDTSQPITYTLEVTNNGPLDAVNVLVTDDLDTTLTNLATTSTGCTITGQTLECSYPLLTVGATETIEITAVPTQVGTVDNTAFVTSDLDDINPLNNFDDESSLVIGTDITVTKTSDGTEPVSEGTIFTYTMIVENLGPSSADNVVLQDTLPGNVNFVSHTNTDNSGNFVSCTTPPVGTNGLVECEWSNLPSGETETVTITVEFPAGNTGAIQNFVVVQTTTEETDMSNNSDQHNHNTNPDESDLMVMKSDSDDPILVGTNTTYTVTVTNNGPEDTTNVLLQDTLPSGVTHVSTTPSGTGTCDTSNLPAITCSWAMLANGASETVDIEVTGDTPTTVTNIVAVASDNTDVNLTNNNATEDTLIVTEITDIQIVEQVVNLPPYYYVGDEVEYQIVVTNNGPDTANDILLTDVLPGEVSFVSIDNPNCTHNSGVISCDLGTLLPTEEVVINIVTTAITEGYDLPSPSEVGTDDFESDYLNNDSDSLINIVERPVIGLTKAITDLQPVSGTTDWSMTYEYVVENVGETILNNITLTEDFESTFSVSPSDIMVNSVVVTPSNPADYTSVVDVAYDGTSTNSTVLAPTVSDHLDVGDSVTVQIEVVISNLDTNYEYLNTADAMAFGLSDIDRDGTPDDWNNNSDLFDQPIGETSDSSLDVTGNQGMSSDPDGDNDPTNNDTPTPIVIPAPVVGLAKALIGDVVADGEWYQVTFMHRIENLGPTILNNINFYEDLETNFGISPADIDVVSVSLDATNAPDYTIVASDVNYDGSAANSLVYAGTDTDHLDIGDSIDIMMDVRLRNVSIETLYQNSSSVDAIGLLDQDQDGEPDNGVTDYMNTVTDMSQDATGVDLEELRMTIPTATLSDPDGDGDPTNNEDPTPVMMPPEMGTIQVNLDNDLMCEDDQLELKINIENNTNMDVDDLTLEIEFKDEDDYDSLDFIDLEDGCERNDDDRRIKCEERAIGGLFGFFTGMEIGGIGANDDESLSFKFNSDRSIDNLDIEIKLLDVDGNELENEDHTISIEKCSTDTDDHSSDESTEVTHDNLSETGYNLLNVMTISLLLMTILSLGVFTFRKI